MPTCSCLPEAQDSEYDLLKKLLTAVCTGTGGGGGGGVSITAQDEGVTLTTNLALINFVGAGVTATAVGNNVTVTIPSGAAGTLQSGAESIISGVNSVTVVFPIAFASAPHVVVTMSRPTGGASIGVGIDSDTILTTGFRARLAAATPNATYILQWMAHV